MKTIELVEPYFNSLGLRFVAGEGESYAPVMVFMLHDLIYQIVMTDVKKLELNGKAKKMRNEWVRLVHLEFKKFWDKLDDYRRDTLNDMMDEFSEYIANELLIVKCKIMDAVTFMSWEDQHHLADVQLINILSQLSELHWQSIIRERDQDRSKLKYNAAARYYSRGISGYYADKYHRTAEVEGTLEPLMDAVTALDTKMVKWVDSKTTAKMEGKENL